MDTGDCVGLLEVIQDITVTAMNILYERPSNALFIARCCELFAASHRACTASLTTGVTTRSNSDIQNNIHQRAQKILASLLTWLFKALPAFLSHDGKWLQYSDEMQVSK